MTDPKHLLDDAQMQRFIRDGYIQVKADFAQPVHQQVYDALEEVFEKEGNVGNNILPRIPQIKQVFDHPAVAGALTSLLGPGYIMNPHRHCHLNPPGGKGQTWHKDCYVFDHNTRHPCFHWILALYYPQDTTEDMGPTGILPGVHNWEHISHPDASQTTEDALALCGKAGTVTLLHFDAWHRAIANTSANKRYMLKFQFARMEWPPQPTWQHERDDWQLAQPASPTERHVWKWLCGRTGSNAASEPTGTTLSDLDTGSESTRLDAAYALGAPDNLPVLLDRLRREAQEVEDRIEDKTPDNAHGTNPTALRAAQAIEAIGPDCTPLLLNALGDAHWPVRASLCDVIGLWGPAAGDAVPSLTTLLDDKHWWVRRNAVEALGRIGHASGPALPDIVSTLGDEDRRVRRAGTLAVAQLAQRGTSTSDAVPGLVAVLSDEDRYNRFYAYLALGHMDDETARAALLDALFTARWCSLTTSEDRY